MKNTELGKLTYDVPREALQMIAENGRLHEFANTVAAQAASEIYAQIVDQVSQIAVGKREVAGGISVGAVNIFDGGDFGTVPVGPKGPRPKIQVLFGNAGLSHVVDVAAFRG